MQNRKLLVSLLAPLEEESQVFVFNDCFIFLQVLHSHVPCVK